MILSAYFFMSVCEYVDSGTCAFFEAAENLRPLGNDDDKWLSSYYALTSNQKCGVQFSEIAESIFVTPAAVAPLNYSVQSFFFMLDRERLYRICLEVARYKFAITITTATEKRVAFHLLAASSECKDGSKSICFSYEKVCEVIEAL